MIELFLIRVRVFAEKVMTSFSSKWFTPLLLCNSAPLVLCCDWFDRGSRRVKKELVDAGNKEL